MSNWIETGVFGKDIPRKVGVYAIYFDGSLAYIGSSINLFNRLRGHGFWPIFGNKLGYTCRIANRAGWHPKTIRVKYRLIREGDHLSLEYRLIKRLRPPLNLFGTHRTRAEMRREAHNLQARTAIR